MKVALDLLFLEPGRTGGRETYARELLVAMREQRPDVSFTGIVGAQATGEGWWRRQCDELHVLPKVDVVQGRVGWALGELLALPRVRCDVLHGIANFGPVAGRFGRVLTVHDVLHRRRPDLVPRANRLATDLLMRPAVRRADRVLCVSQASASDAVELLGADPAKVVVVPNGITPPPAGFARDVEPGMVLCVASHLPHKGLDVLRAAWERAGGPGRLVLAGAGTEALPEGVGAVGPDELEALYARAAMVALPTRFEGFGLPVLEAVARGVPVACSDLPVLREVAGDAVAYVPVDDVDAWADVLRAGAAGLPVARPEAAAEFTWARAAEATLAAYDAVV